MNIYLRTMPATVALILLFTSESPTSQLNQFGPKNGSKNDQCGELEWSSTVTSTNNAWDFKRIVTNKDKQAPCAIHWINKKAKWRTVVVSLKSAEWSDNGRLDGPEEVVGKIEYRGKMATESATADAIAWLPKGTAQAKSGKALESTATTAFIHEKDLYYCTAKSVSNMKDGGAGNHEITVKITLVFEGDKTKLPNGLALSWTSIEFSELLKTKKLVRIFDGKRYSIPLDEKTQNFTASVLIRSTPVAREGLVQIPVVSL